MFYLIMRAIAHDQSEIWDTPLDNPVGVFRLCYEKTNTLWHLVRTTKQEIFIRGANLESSRYTGPELLGLMEFSALNLSDEQQQHYETNGWIVMPMETGPAVCQSDNESIHVSAADGSLYWRCDGWRKAIECGEYRGSEYLGTFSVRGPQFENWKLLLDFIKGEEIAEAKKQPLTWQEARAMVLRSGTNGTHIARQVTEEHDVGLLASAIDAALADTDRGTLSYKERARLECTLARINGLL
ncbi:MAG: hypothetical protein RBT34_00305 [Anaerolineaceae bacterium]|jgi:hypothetical protein|nr:hypothetical protein [Anaerolineaceae bacterium]